MRVALILVHYRTPELLAGAIDAVRADAHAAGISLSIVVVDNGSDADDRSAFDACNATVLRPGANLGYGAGANLGAAESLAAGAPPDALLFMNPDVLVRPGCLGSLAACLSRGAGAAGPRLWWDDERTLLLPPTERRGPIDEALRSLGAASPRWARRARRRWRAHAQRHWTAAGPVRSRHLSGAMLVVSVPAWRRVGPFDEDYRLYFEETDWLRRARRAGFTVVYEPRAEAIHDHGRSSAREPQASAWYAASEARYLRRRHGSLARALLGVLRSHSSHRDRRSVAAAPSAPAPVSVRCRAADGASARWIELSSDVRGYPAAGAQVDPSRSTWSIPEALWCRLEPGSYRLLPVTGAGRELPSREFRVEARPSRGRAAVSGRGDTR